MELALVSFDGLDPRVVYRNRDKLENFDSLLDNTVHGTWRTPGHTIPSFIATLTGKQYNEKQFHWDDDRANYQRHRQTEYDFLWDICDCSMTILNSPVLYPPEDIEDAMVCGFLTPDELVDSNLAEPDTVQTYLNEIDYTHDIPADKTYEELGGEGMLRKLSDIMDRRVTVADWLIDKYDSDLFYGVWTSTDRWFHQCHLHDEEYMPMYEKADRVLGRMIDIIPEDIPLMVFSDHGFAHSPTDRGVHKGHMYDGFYSIRHPTMPSYRDDTASIFDLFPTVLNYFDCGNPGDYKGRVLFHRDDQSEQVKDRLSNLGYLE